jgi:hypothetical protein
MMPSIITGSVVPSGAAMAILTSIDCTARFYTAFEKRPELRRRPGNPAVRPECSPKLSRTST